MTDAPAAPNAPADLDADADTDERTDVEQAQAIAEEEGENFYSVLHEQFGWSADQIRDRYLDPYDQEPDADLIAFLNDEASCTNEELGLTDAGEFEDS